jgi:hypothetical protein
MIALLAVVMMTAPIASAVVTTFNVTADTTTAGATTEYTVQLNTSGFNSLNITIPAGLGAVVPAAGDPVARVDLWGAGAGDYANVTFTANSTAPSTTVDVCAYDPDLLGPYVMSGVDYAAGGVTDMLKGEYMVNLTLPTTGADGTLKLSVSGEVEITNMTVKLYLVKNPTTAGTHTFVANETNSSVVTIGTATPVIEWIKFNSSVNETATAGNFVNVSVNVSDGEGWGNIDKVVVNMSAFGAGSAEELTRMTNDTYWAVFNKSIQVTKFVGSTGAQVTANVTDKSSLSADATSTGKLNVTTAAKYQLKIFGPDSSAPNNDTLYQQVAIQDQYGNNLTTANTFTCWVTMSKTGDAEIKAPNPQWINTTNTTAEGVFDTTFEVYDESDEETTIKVTGEGLLPHTKTLTYYGTTHHLDVRLNETSMNANGGNDAILVEVQLKDASGSDIKSVGESVQISQNTGAGLFGGLTSNTTDANGKTTFVIISTTKSGSDEIYAIATPSGATGTSDTITVTAIVSPANSAMKPAANINVAAGTALSVNVTTKDYDNQIISGVTVTFNITSGNGTLDGTSAGTPITAVSDGDGLAEVTFVCNTADDVNKINATVDDLSDDPQKVANADQYTITIVPNVINQFAVSPGKSIGLKNVPGTKQDIAIQLKDVHSNNNTTAGVQILVTTGNTALGNMTNGTTYYNNDLYLTTGAGGIATFTYQVNASEAGTANLAINATAYGVLDTIVIVTSGPTGIHLSFNESIPMVGESVLATAQLTNEAGDSLAIGDKNITFTVRNPSGTLVGTNGTLTEGNGAATFMITPAMVNGVPGAYTVTAKNHLYGLEDVNTTTFVGHAVELVLEANRTTLMVNQTVSLNATMKDANGLTTSSLDDSSVTFNANGVQIANVVLNNGVASTTYTRSTSATVTIEAFFNVSLQDSVSVEFTEVELANMTVTATPATINVSEATDITINVTDEITGAPIDGAIVTLEFGGSEIANCTTSAGECTAAVNVTETGTINVSVTATEYNDGSDTVTVTVGEESLFDRYDTNKDGVISKDEAIAAITDYFDDKISKDDAIQVITWYFD